MVDCLFWAVIFVMEISNRVQTRFSSEMSSLCSSRCFRFWFCQLQGFPKEILSFVIGELGTYTSCVEIPVSQEPSFQSILVKFCFPQCDVHWVQISCGQQSLAKLDDS